MLSPYRRVLSEPGALRFSLSGFFARLPISMVSLGIVLLVAAESGSYALAGSVSAAYLIANALLSIVHGKMVDRLGQRRVLPPAILVFTVALAAMMIAVESGAPTPIPHLLAAVAGGALPQIGSCVRARWSHVLREPAGVQTAYAFEAVVDEAVFMLGPTVVTVLATTWHPVAGLVTAVVSGLAGTLALAAQHGTEPPTHRHHESPTGKPAMPWRVVAPLTGVCLALGTLFGSTEVATVAFTDERGSDAAAGVLLALWALGSLLSGVISGAVTWRVGPAVRVRWGILALALTMAPLPFVDGLLPMGALLLLGGFAISPTLIATMSLVEESVPAARLTEGMSVLHTGMAAGVAPGAAIAGIIIDELGASPAYVVPVVAGLLGAVAAFATRERKVTTRVGSAPG